MTTYRETTLTCPACGNTDAYTALMSTNAFGSADLDLRPPPMERNTMHAWIRCCQKCSCCFQDHTTKEDLNLENMQSEVFIQTRKDESLPDLAKSFACFAILTKEYDRESIAWLQSAWVCDDTEQETHAREFRKKAYQIIAQNYQHGSQHRAANYQSNPEKGLMALDLLRRSQDYERAKEIIDTVAKAVDNSNDPNKKIMASVVRFQSEKINALDARTYTIQDAIDHVQKES